MQTRLTTLLTTVLLITTSPMSNAGDRFNNQHTFTDYAKVLQVTPRFRTVTQKIPRRNCDIPNQRRHRHNQLSGQSIQRRHSQPGAVLAGGVIGGVIGHELARGFSNGGHAGVTVAGAIVGAGLSSAHSRLQQNHGARRSTTQHEYHAHRQHNTQPQNSAGYRCTTTVHVQHSRQPDGYTVSYRYRGRIFETHTQHHPGDKIPVRVAITTR